jgi:hypothetical protein
MIKGKMNNNIEKVEKSRNVRWFDVVNQGNARIKENWTKRA